MRTAFSHRVRVAYIAVLAVLLILGPFNLREAKASHGVGAEITYECLGGNLYQFTLNFYRDCSGSAAPATQLITIASAACGVNFSFSLNQLGPGQDISPLCPTALSECAGGTEPGVEKYTYQDTLTLPFNCPDWIFSHEQCCRNWDITNLVNPSIQSLHVRSTLDNSLGICNTSPAFTTSPVPYICDSQLVNYNMGTYDPDGDSLHYTLVNALGASGTPLAYTGGYSPTYPISTTTGSVNFDQNSGNLKINPDSIQVGVVTVLVEEYRNGILIGSVMRDVQIRVLDCPTNLIPFMTSGGIVNLTGGGILVDSNTVKVCMGAAVNFDVTGSDLNVGDVLSMTTNLALAIPGASFTTTGVLPVEGSFSWVPTAADSGIHIFTVTIEDDACPILGVQSYAFEIIVEPSTNAGPDAVYCPGGVPAQLNATGGTAFTWSPSAGLSCTNCPNPVASPSVTTTYTVTSNLSSSCPNTDMVQVSVTGNFSMALSPSTDTICRNESVQLDVSTNPVDGPFIYNWENPNLDLSDPTIANPIATPSDTTVYVVKVTAGSGCTQEDSLEIVVAGVAPFVLVSPPDTNLCAGESLQLEAIAVLNPPSCALNLLFVCSGPTQGGIVGNGTLSTWELGPFNGGDKKSKSQYLYLASDLINAGFTGGVIESIGWNILSKNSSAPYSGFNIGMTCTSDDALDNSKWFTTLPVFSGTYNTVPGINMVSLDDAYSWDGVSNLVVEVCWTNTTITADDSIEYANTSYFATVNNSGSMGSGCTLSPAFDHKKLPNLFLQLCQQTLPKPIYTWTPAAGLSNDTIADPIASPSVSTTYTVTVQDSGSTCIGSANTTINVGANFTLSTSNDTTICFGDTIGISTVPSNAGVYTYYWEPPYYISDTVVQSPLVFPPDSLRYYVFVTNGGCDRIDSVDVYVSGRSLRAGADPMVICPGPQVVNLNVAGLGSPSICGPSTDFCIEGLPFDIGDGGVSNTSTAYPAPYGNRFKNAKHQILYLASDLQDWGLEAGTISSLGFNIDVVNGATNYKNFTLKIGCTPTSNLVTWEPGLTPVFSPKTVNIVPGWNVYSLDTNYNWDGISNLVVEVCFDNRSEPNFTLNSSTFYTVTGYSSVVYYNNNLFDACATSISPTSSTNRPDIRFNLCYSDTALPVGYTYNWTPTTGLSNPNIQNPTASISGPSTYSVAITDLNGCIFNEEVTITQNNVSATIVDVGQIRCTSPNSGFATGRLGGGAPPYTYLWDDPGLQTDSTATGLVAGTYTVIITDGYGCSANASVTLVPPPTPLAGVYTIGGVTPDFVNFTQAVNALNVRGVSAPVLFNVRSGTYVEQIQIDSICNVSNVNNVVFQSEVLDSTTVTLTFAASVADNYTLRFNNADFVTFRLMTLSATDADNGRVVELVNGASNIKLVRNILNGVSTLLFSDQRAVVYQALGNGQNNWFLKNIFNEGSRGLNVITAEPGMLIKGNQFLNQYFMGIWMENKKAVTIADNFIRTNASTASYYGIYMLNCDSNIVVESNKISSGTADGYGMLLINCDGTLGARGLISNNFIQMGVAGAGYGIHLSANNNLINVFHNSIHITSTSTTNARPLFVGSTGSNITVHNNIFSNSGGGYTVYLTNTTVVSAMDYNDLHTTGPILGYEAGTTYPSLAPWRLGTGHDLNSVSVDPIYTSIPNLHLTVSSPGILQSGNNLLFDVPVDIDDTVRSTVPWMGAHEYKLVPCTPFSLTSTAVNNSCFGDTTGSISVTVISGGTPPYNYLWDDPAFQTNDTVFNLYSGTYEVRITDALGCIDSLTDIVTEPPALIPFMLDSTDLSCFGSNDGTAIVQATGGTLPYLFSWFPSGITNDTATGLAGGLHTVTITDNNGCSVVDSVTLDEPISMIVAITDSADISCNGLSDGFAVATATGGTSPYGFFWSPSGSTNDTAFALGTGINWVMVTDIQGCSDSDSVTIDEPSVLIPDAGIFTSICFGDSLQIGGTPSASGGVGLYTYLWDPVSTLNDATQPNPIANPTVSTTYLLTVTDGNGCISTDATTISVNPMLLTLTTDTICSNDSVLLGGAYQNTAGTYIDTLPSSNGCDSIVTTTLTVNPTFALTTSETICAGDSMLLGGAFQNTPGTYVDTFQTNSSCDSIVTTTLIVNPTYAINLTDTLCDGDSVLVAGIWQTTSGVYWDSTISINGCDSIVSTTLVVNPTYALAFTDTICDGDSIQIGGIWQTTSGVYTDSATTISGCDSIISTTLIVNPTYTLAFTDTICDTDSMLLGGAYQNTPGTYIDSLLSSSGCDSVITTTLFINPTYAVNSSNTICVGDSILLAGAWQTTSGIYQDSLVSANGCDSIVTTSLTVNPSYALAFTDMICDGDSIQIGGIWQTTSGVYIDSATTMNGCDSIISTTLIVNPSYILVFADTICSGDSILLGGVYQTTAGTYMDTLFTSTGCDSIVSTILVVNPSYTVATAAAICSADSVLLGGAFQNTSGIYVDTLQTNNGCDSIVSTTLTVNQAYVFILFDTICDGDSVLLAGIWQTTSGVYADSTATINGCDSIVVTTLTVFSPALTSSSISICDGDSVFLEGAYQFITGTYVDSFSSIVTGCDSSLVTTNLTVGNPIVLATSSVNPSCANSCDGQGVATVSGGTGTFAFSWNTVPVQTTATAGSLCAGTYLVSVTDAAGCSSMDSVTIISPAPMVPLITASFNPSCFGLCDGMATASGFGGVSPYTYLWDDPAAQTTVSAIGLCAGTYAASVMDANGCIASVSVTLTDPAAMNVTIGGIDSICVGSCNGTAVATVVGGTAPLIYSWSNGPSSTAISGLCIGTYSVSVTDANTCVAADTVTISNYPVENASFSYSGLIFCQNISNPLPTVTGNAGGTFSAPPNLTLIPSTGEILLGASVPGTYNIVYTTGGPCPTSDTVQVTISAVPSVSIASVPAVCGIDTGLISLSGTPALGTWSGNGIVDSVNGLFSPLVSGPGLWPVVYTVAGAGCANSDTVMVPILLTPNMTLIGTQTICAGDSATFILNMTGLGPFQIVYTDGSSQITLANVMDNDLLTLSPFITTTYTLISLTDSANCTGTIGGSLTVTVAPAPLPPIVDSLVSYCEGDPGPFLNAVPQSNGNIEWFDNLSSPPIATGNAFTPLTFITGSNYFYVTESVGACTSAAVEVELIVYSQGSVDAGEDVTLCLGNSVELLATGGVQYAWYPSTGLSDTSIANPVARPAITTTYFVIATVDSCTYQDSVRVIIDNTPNCGWHIYNGFTPNGDGDNDLWIIDGISSFRENKVTIFNRWEDVVQSFEGYDNETVVWKGDNRGGQDLPQGTYFYIIEAGEEKFVGWVQLTR